MYSITFYPDPTGAGNSMDGWAAMNSTSTGITWAAAQGGAGDDSWYSALGTGSGLFVRIVGSDDNVAQSFDFLARTIIMFDTSVLGDSINIVNATLSAWLVGKSDSLGISMDVNVFSSNPASNNALVNADYTTLGVTPFSTAIPYASTATGGYNDFPLNGNGIAAINLVGTSKFGMRNENYDVNNIEPTSAAGTSLRVSGFQFVTSQSGGTTADPKLVVNFSLTTPNIFMY